MPNDTSHHHKKVLPYIFEYSDDVIDSIMSVHKMICKNSITNLDDLKIDEFGTMPDWRVLHNKKGVAAEVNYKDFATSLYDNLKADKFTFNLYSKKYDIGRKTSTDDPLLPYEVTSFLAILHTKMKTVPDLCRVGSRLGGQEPGLVVPPFFIVGNFIPNAIINRNSNIKFMLSTKGLAGAFAGEYHNNLIKHFTFPIIQNLFSSDMDIMCISQSEYKAIVKLLSQMLDRLHEQQRVGSTKFVNNIPDFNMNISSTAATVNIKYSLSAPDISEYTNWWDFKIQFIDPEFAMANRVTNLDIVEEYRSGLELRKFTNKQEDRRNQLARIMSSYDFAHTLTFLEFMPDHNILHNNPRSVDINKGYLSCPEDTKLFITPEILEIICKLDLVNVRPPEQVSLNRLQKFIDRGWIPNPKLPSFDKFSTKLANFS